MFGIINQSEIDDAIQEACIKLWLKETGCYIGKNHAIRVMNAFEHYQIYGYYPENW